MQPISKTDFPLEWWPEALDQSATSGRQTRTMSLDELRTL